MFIRTKINNMKYHLFAALAYNIYVNGYDTDRIRYDGEYSIDHNTDWMLKDLWSCDNSSGTHWENEFWEMIHKDEYHAKKYNGDGWRETLEKRYEEWLDNYKRCEDEE